MKKKSYKFQDISRFFILMGILGLANYVLSAFYLRLDLTEDKRYSVSEASISIMKNLKTRILVDVYLEGEFPAGFQRLQKTIRETLEEFRSYSGNRIEYRFTNPSAIPDAKTRNEEYEKLAKSGLQPTNLMVKEGAEQVQKIIFPGAIVRVKDKEIPVQFLKGNQAASPQERLNQSVEGVEFELANAIKMASQEKPARIAILSGHGELKGKSLQDLALTLKQYYTVEPADLSKIPDLEGYDAAIMAKPQTQFSEFEKFKLDQFIVKGGKMLFFVDGIRAGLDSIKTDGSLAFPYPLNLEDLFQKLGFRINPDLLLDMNCGAIPLVVGYLGDKPETRLVPWRYYPVLNDFGKHTIVKNMDALYGRFVSTIDTFVSPHIRKTPLVFSSRYSKTVASPVRLSFNEARLNPQPEQYKMSRLPVVYLLEGKFVSLYQNRMVPESDKQLGFKETDKSSKVLVVADGDFVKNDTTRSGEYFGLGFDRFMRTTFANKDLVLNALSYLLDENGAILARARTIALRPLDIPRINKEKNMWQILNIAGPVFLTVLFGMVRLFLRNRKYRAA